MREGTFYQGMALILKTFNLFPDDKTIDVWKMLLLDLGDEEFIKAVIHLCRTKGKVPPNIVAAIREEIEGANPSAEEAWGKVILEIASTGYYGTPKFDDPAITQAVQAMGWREICSTPHKEMGIVRAHFYRTYDAHRKREVFVETNKVIETNVAIKKLLEQIGKPIPKIPSTT